MKHSIFMMGAMLIGATSFAQNNSTSFTVKAGMMQSDIKGEALNSLQNVIDLTKGAVQTKGLTGYYAGVNMNIPISEQITLMPGAVFSQKGMEIKGDLTIKALDLLGVQAGTKLVSNYIDIPVLLKADLGSGFHVFAGPQVSYLLNSNLRTTAGLLGINLLKKDIDVTNQFNPWDAAATGGVGYSFGNISLQASYDYGLTKLDKNRQADSRMQGFRIGLGINF